MKHFFRTTATIKGKHRNKGVTRYFKDVDQITCFLEAVANDGNLKDCNAIRLVPVKFDNPEKGIKKAVKEHAEDYGYW